MKYERYDQETAYQTGKAADHLYALCYKLDNLISKIDELIDLERSAAQRNAMMLSMQEEMFEDYKKVKEQAHVKLQGDMEGNHATAHTA